MTTIRHTVDFPYIPQELQALLRCAREHDVERGGHYDTRSEAIIIWSHLWAYPAMHEASETIGTFDVHWDPPALYEIAHWNGHGTRVGCMICGRDSTWVRSPMMPSPRTRHTR